MNIISVKKTYIRFLPNFVADILWQRRTTCCHFHYLFLQVSYATQHLWQKFKQVLGRLFKNINGQIQNL